VRSTKQSASLIEWGDLLETRSGN